MELYLLSAGDGAPELSGLGRQATATVVLCLPRLFSWSRVDITPPPANNKQQVVTSRGRASAVAHSRRMPGLIPNRRLGASMLSAVPSPAKEGPDTSPIATVPEIVDEIRRGNIVVLVDDEDRENEGDLVFAADFVTAEKINFLARYGRGLICMPITAEHGAQLALTPMAARNRSVHGTTFTVSIEAAQGVTTGISAADRAHTIRVACAPGARPQDI